MANYVNSYNGALEHLGAYDMDSLEEILYGTETRDLIQMVQYGDFNIHDGYFRFNGYGNLESLTYYQYEVELLENEDEIVLEYTNLANYGDLLLSDYNALNN